MNRSKDLRELFRKSLINERKCHKTNYVDKSPMYNFMGGVHKIPNQYDSVRIYFYEWSDPTKFPRTFYQIDSFENFLKSCGIYMEPYQKDIIMNLGTVYVTCYTGTKLLSIRATHSNLLNSLHEHDQKRLIPSVQKYNFIFEPEGRWPQNDGNFFG